MNENKYNTKQRAGILSFLKENCERALTADEIVALLKERGCTVGRTTVYRYIDALTRSGQVRKFSLENEKSATYQYVPNHESCHEHMHLKCVCCGKLVHLSCDFVSEICSHIHEYHGFTVDNAKTTLLGVCADCQGKENADGIDRV